MSFVEAIIKCIFKECSALWILSSCRRFRIIMTIFPVKWKKISKFHTLKTHIHNAYSALATPCNFRHFEFPNAIYISLRCNTMYMFTFMVFLLHMGRMQGIWPVITCIVENIVDTCIWRNVIAEVTTIELSTIFSLSKTVFFPLSATIFYSS